MPALGILERSASPAQPPPPKRVKFFADEEYDRAPPKRRVSSFFDNPGKRIKLFGDSDDEKDVTMKNRSENKTAGTNSVGGQRVSIPPPGFNYEASDILSPTLPHSPGHEDEVQSSQEQMAGMDLDEASGSAEEGEVIEAPSNTLWSQESGEIVETPTHVHAGPFIFSQEEGEIVETPRAGEFEKTPPAEKLAAPKRQAFAVEIIRKPTPVPARHREEVTRDRTPERAAPAPPPPRKSATPDKSPKPEAPTAEHRSRTPSAADNAALFKRIAGDKYLQTTAAQAPKSKIWDPRLGSPVVTHAPVQQLHPSQRWRVVRASETKSSSPPKASRPAAVDMSRAKSEGVSAARRVKPERNVEAPPIKAEDTSVGGDQATRNRSKSFSSSSAAKPAQGHRASMPQNGVWSLGKRSASSAAAAPKRETPSAVSKVSVPPARPLTKANPDLSTPNAAKPVQIDGAKPGSETSLVAAPRKKSPAKAAAPVGEVPPTSGQQAVSASDAKKRDEATRRIKKLRSGWKLVENNHRVQPNFLDWYQRSGAEGMLRAMILDLSRTNMVGVEALMEDQMQKLEKLLEKMQATRSVLTDSVKEDLDALSHKYFELGDFRSTDLIYRDMGADDMDDSDEGGGPPSQPPSSQEAYTSGPFRGIVIGQSKRGSNTYRCPMTEFKRDFKVFGDNGLKVGDWWPFQICVLRDGAHGSSQGGISGNLVDGAYSVVISGGYKENNEDHGDYVYYSGAGGMVTKDGKQGTTQTEHQTDVRSTKYLIRSYETQRPLRVVRSSKLDSSYAPRSGFRYDGKYVVRSHAKKWNAAMLKYDCFRLERLRGQEPICRDSPTAAQVREVQKYVKSFE